MPDPKPWCVYDMYNVNIPPLLTLVAIDQEWGKDK